MNRGVEIESAVADDIQRSAITEQVEMGVAVRMAVLYLLLGAGADLVPPAADRTPEPEPVRA